MAQLKSKFLENAAVTAAKIANAAVDENKLAASVAGDGLTGGAGSPLAVGAGSGISVAADSVAVDSTVVRTNGANAFTADQSMGSHKLTNVTDPTSAQDAATKAYVDGVASGLDVKQSVRLASAAALSANTAAGSGVGKTLTANANGALSVDGVAVAVGNRLLIKDEATGANNGIYTVTATGGAGAPYVLTRATDADQNAEVTAGLFTFVEEGTANADSGWVLTTDNPITVDTTSLAFSQFSQTGTIIAGAGLTRTGNTIDFNTADTSLTVNADNVAVNLNATGGLQTSSGLKIKQDTVTANTIGVTSTANGAGVLFDANSFADSGSETLALASNVAGSGLALSSGQLSVKIDSATTKINGSSQVESLKERSEEFVLGAGDITNQYIDLAHAIWGTSATINSAGLFVVGGPMQRKGSDYTVSLTGGSGGVTRVTFAGDLATGGNAALVATDVVVVSYQYLT